MYRTIIAIFALVLAFLPGVNAQPAALDHTPAKVVPSTAIPSNNANNSPVSTINAPLRTISPGVFELGDVRIDKNQRSVSFPAKLNMNKGLMEYFLVTSYGKTHESVLRTEAAPYQIHVAMLLLGAKVGTNQLKTLPSPNISNPAKTALPGDKITLSISWTADGKEIRRPAEDLILDRETGSTMKPGGWVYNGSAVWSGTFLAQREGSIVSLVTDPSALINYTGPGHDNDQVWTPNTNSLPPFDLPVQVTVQLDPAPKQ